MAVVAVPGHHALLPRYRRVLGAGALLDECIHLFQEHWRTFAVISSVGLVPLGVVNLGLSLAAQRTGTLALAFDVVRVLALTGINVIVSVVLGTLWSAAVTQTTDDVMRDARPTLGRAYGVAVRRLLPLIGSALLVFVAVLVLGLVSVVLATVTVWVVGALIAGVGLLFWARRPRARQSWLKWLIVLTAPFGLVMFVLVRWSMLGPAVVLERCGPVDALRRSNGLVRGQWFHTAAVLFVAIVIDGVVVSAPSYLVSLPLNLTAAARGALGQDPVENVVAVAVSLVCQVLFASIAAIAPTILFTELRNRREGADIAERVQLMETPAPA